MDLTPFLTTFGIIALAELGDKTQFTVIALSTMFHKSKVFLGAILAFALITGLGVVVGDTLLHLVKPEYVHIIAGLMFVVFGIWILLSKPYCDAGEYSPVCTPFLSTFGIILLAEMGDKTQLSAMTLSANYHAPFLVFFGAVCALGLVSVLGLVAGKRLTERVSLSKIRLGAGALFLLLGMVFLAGF